MSLLVESIKADNGILLNLSYHNERLIRSLQDLFGRKTDLDLGKIISIPAFAEQGIFKCRVEYDEEIRKVEFLPYSRKPVNSLKLVEDNDIDYQYKYVDRTLINALMAKRGDNDDILIIKNGLVTDTSYANIVFKDSKGMWFTPASCLLAGTKRAVLLRTGVIKEAVITVSDIKKYSEARIINAMIDINDAEGISIGNII